MLRRQGSEVVEDLFDEDQTDLVEEDDTKKDVVELEVETEAMDSGAMTPPTLEPDLIAAMAQEATSTGVMQAVVGTEQGATGWYVDANATMQHWTVGDDGSWTRTEG